MSSPELIGKMCAGAMKLDSVRGSGVSLLSKAELAGVLAKLSAHEMNLALAKYMDDSSSQMKLVANVQAWATERAVRDGWKPRSSELLAAMARLAVFEVLGNGICDKCNGTGLISPIRVCKSCNGTGYKQISGRRKADMLGVVNKRWLDTWKARYELVFDYVQGLDSTVLRHLHFAEFEKMEAEYFDG